MFFTNGKIDLFSQEYDEKGAPIGAPVHDGEEHNITVLPGRIHVDSTMVRHDDPTNSPNYVPFHKKICLLSSIKEQFAPGNVFGLEWVDSAANTSLMNHQFGPNMDPYGREIKYFCCGKGGVLAQSIDKIEMASPASWESRLYTIMPFSMKREGEVAERGHAFPVELRYVKDDTIYTCYFLKELVDIQPLAVVKNNAGEMTDYYDVDKTATDYYHDSDPRELLTDEGALEAKNIYVNHVMRMDITPSDMRDFFSLVYGTTPKPSWNMTEIGLVLTGIGDSTKDVELFSKMITTPRYLDSKTNGRLLMYELFA
jgi:hypothetical protein